MNQTDLEIEFVRLVCKYTARIAGEIDNEMTEHATQYELMQLEVGGGIRIWLGQSKNNTSASDG